MSHVWQTFSECCTKCGVNAYERDAALSCKRVLAKKEKEAVLEEKRLMQEYLDDRKNSCGW